MYQASVRREPGRLSLPTDEARSVPSSTPPAASLDALHRRFAPVIAEIDRALHDYLSSMAGPASHYGMLSYHFGFADADLKPLSECAYLARGKRLRPLISMLFGRLYGLPPAVTSQLMMAAEVMHSASLAHDDIEDRDAVRWNRPTLQAAFGMEQAINAGDTLIGMVYQLLLRLPALGVTPALTLEVVAAFNRAHLLMCEGQHLDLKFCYDDLGCLAAYQEIVERKTGAACVCILESVGLLADASAAVRQQLSAFGRALGTLYQICDDVRGIWSNPGELGREIGHDVILQRPSLPLLYACQHAAPALRAMLLGKPGRPAPLNADELNLIRAELATCGAATYCLDAAIAQHEAALAALAGTECSGPEMDVLRGILGACLSAVEILVRAPRA